MNFDNVDSDKDEGHRSVEHPLLKRVGQEHNERDGNEDAEDESTFGKLYDTTVHRPCQALGSFAACGNDAVETMGSMVCVGCLGPPSQRQPHAQNVFAMFRSPTFFPSTGPHDGENDDEDASPYLYSRSAPVGPVACEYCGRSNAEDCTSNLPGDDTRNHDGDPGGDDGICPRPKLFFLKKIPPFATPDGWNPITEYRNVLLEPPRSLEARRAAWGEVRGALGQGSNHGRGKFTVGHVRGNDGNSAS